MSTFDRPEKSDKTWNAKIRDIRLAQIEKSDSEILKSFTFEDGDLEIISSRKRVSLEKVKTKFGLKQVPVTRNYYTASELVQLLPKLSKTEIVKQLITASLRNLNLG